MRPLSRKRGWDVMVPCPYCPNPDRRAVFNDRMQSCQWREDRRVSQGADPPCVCDGYALSRKEGKGMTIGLAVMLIVAGLGLWLLWTALFGASTGNGAEDAMGSAILGAVGAAVLVIDFIAFLIWLAVK